MANNTVTRTVSIFIESGEAQKSFDKLIAKEKELKEQLSKATNPADIKRLQTELDKLAAPIDRATKKLKGELQPSIRELSNTVKSLNKELLNTDRGTEAFTRLSIKLQKATLELHEARNAAAGFNQSFLSVLKQEGVGAALTKFAAFGGIISGAFFAASAAVSNFFSGTIEEAEQAEQAQAKLKSILEATGRSDAFERLLRSADGFQQKLKVLDNDDITRVFAKLVTYGKLSEQQIIDLTDVIAKFSIKQRVSLDEATSVILKALEGSAKGLKEYGINIKDAGTEAERFNLIMSDLKPKVDDATESLGDETKSILTNKQAIKDLQEEIGGKLLPIKSKLLSFVNESISAFSALGLAIKDIFTGRNESNQFIADDIIKNTDASKNVINQFTNQLVSSYKDLNKKITETNKDMAAEQLEVLQENFITKLNINIADAKRRIEKGFTVEEIKFAKEQLASFQNALDQINRSANDKPFFPVADDKGNKQKANNILKQQEDLAAELKRIAEDLALFNADQLQKELIAADRKYDTLAVKAKGNAVLLKQVEELRLREQNLILDKYQKIATENYFKELEKREQRRKQLEQQTRFTGNANNFNNGLNQVEAVANRLVRDRDAKIELEILQSTGRKKLEAQKQQLENQRRAELDNASLTVNEIAIINERYRQKELELDRQFQQQRIQNILNFAQEGLNQLNSVFNILNSADELRIEAEKANTERRKANLKNELDSKLISNKEYFKKITELDNQQRAREAAIKRKEFTRNQIAAGIQATINIAEAVTKAFTAGPIIGQILAGIVAAAGVAQLAIIASQKPPQFAKGGKLSGRLHSQGGNPIINPITGLQEAEIERGELITNRRAADSRNMYSVTGTPSQIISTLNSRYGGVSWDQPAALQPLWRTGQVSTINYSNVSSSLPKARRYESGGTFSSNNTGQLSEQALLVLDDMKNTINGLKQTLDNGIVAYSLISQQQKQEARLNAIITDATMK